MNMPELVNAVHEMTPGLTKADIKAVIDATFETIRDSLLDCEDFTIKGVGRIYVADVKERQMTNFQTGEPMTVPAHKALKFKPAASLRTELRQL